MRLEGPRAGFGDLGMGAISPARGLRSTVRFAT